MPVACRQCHIWNGRCNSGCRGGGGGGSGGGGGVASMTSIQGVTHLSHSAVMHAYMKAMVRMRQAWMHLGTRGASPCVW
jgi:hypothetical protein